MRTFKNWIIAGIFAFTASAGMAAASELQDSPADERMSISFGKVKICHQHAWRNLAINVAFSTESMDDDATLSVAEVKEYIRSFLGDYSNPDDFWEVMNVNLVKALAKAYPQIVLLESTLTLSPDDVFIYPRSSYVTYDSNVETLKEGFSFTKLNYLVCHETFRSLDLHVYFDLKANPTPEDYPDYQWVDDAMKAFFAEHPVSLSQWNTLRPDLENHILTHFPSLTAVRVTVAAAN